MNGAMEPSEVLDIQHDFMYTPCHFLEFNKNLPGHDEHAVWKSVRLRVDYGDVADHEDRDALSDVNESGFEVEVRFHNTVIQIIKGVKLNEPIPVFWEGDLLPYMLLQRRISFTISFERELNLIPLEFALELERQFITPANFYHMLSHYSNHTYLNDIRLMKGVLYNLRFQTPPKIQKLIPTPPPLPPKKKKPTLQELINEAYYRPGFPGYQEAKKSWEQV